MPAPDRPVQDSPPPVNAAPTPPNSPMNPWLKLATDIGPIVAFFAVYHLYGLMPATAVLMAATLAALATGYARERRLALMPLITCAVVLVFGGLTLLLDNELFIKMKPTIIYSLFAAVLLGGLAFGRSFLQPLFGPVWQLNPGGWRQLTLRFGVFFVGMALLNEAVWRSFSTDVWVNFKLFGAIPLTLLFAALQTPLIQRHQIEEAAGPEA